MQHQETPYIQVSWACRDSLDLGIRVQGLTRLSQLLQGQPYYLEDTSLQVTSRADIREHASKSSVEAHHWSHWKKLTPPAKYTNKQQNEATFALNPEPETPVQHPPTACDDNGN